MKKTFTLKDIRITQANRDVLEGHVEKLKQLIQKHGYIKSLPIIVDPDGCIIDGQHRYLACKELKVEPTIVVEEDDFHNLVPVINANQKKWSFADFVKYYSNRGLEHFVILEQVCKAKGLSPSIVYAIIYGKMEKQGIRKHGRMTKDHPLKDGTFKFPDTSEKGLKKLERKIDNILNLIHILQLPRTDRLVLAITRLAQNPNFSFETMEKKIEYQRSRIFRCTTIAEYTAMLTSIYNYKNAKKI